MERRRAGSANVGVPPGAKRGVDMGRSTDAESVQLSRSAFRKYDGDGSRGMCDSAALQAFALL